MSNYSTFGLGEDELHLYCHAAISIYIIYAIPINPDLVVDLAARTTKNPMRQATALKMLSC